VLNPPSRNSNIVAGNPASLVERAVQRLSNYERDFVLRLVYDEQPVERIADDLGISINTPRAGITTAHRQEG